MASSRPAITALDFYFLGVVFLIWTATCIRFPRMRLRFARAIGRIAYRLSGTKRRHSERNIAEAFEGKLTPERVRMITRRSFQQFWLEVFSMPAPMVQELGRAHIEFRGLEHLRHALGKNRGVILWESNSFGSKFLAKKSLYQQGFAVLAAVAGYASSV
jgi:lauroyl/myristoyl acyltransferase